MGYRSTVNPPIPQQITPYDRWLCDPTTGQILGVQSAKAGIEDAWFVPIQLTAAQIASPTAEMLAEVNALFQLNVAPYTRYVSNGTDLVSLIDSTVTGFPTTIPAGSSMDVAAGSEWTPIGPVVVQGQLSVEGVVIVT